MGLNSLHARFFCRLFLPTSKRGFVTRILYCCFMSVLHWGQLLLSGFTHTQNASLRASSPIWASEASLARTCERGSRETHFTRRNRRACSQANKMLVPSYENKQISPGSIKHNKSLVWRHTTVSIKLEKADPYRRFNRRQETVSMPKDSLK